MNPHAIHRWFLALARAEGCSAIALFFIGMPLKYGAGLPEATLWTGWLHGSLFLVYLVALWSAGRTLRWRWSTLALGVVCAIIPAATFWFERQLPEPSTTAP